MRLKLTTIRCKSGEHLPLLLTADGTPHFNASVYLVSELRSQRLAVSTLRHHLRGVRHLEEFCSVKGIDLGSRLNEGRLLSLAEIDELAASCRVRSDELSERLMGVPPPRSKPVRRRVSGSKERSRCTTKLKADTGHLVSLNAAGARLHSIKHYLDWVARDQLAKPIREEIRAHLSSARDTTLENIRARVPGYSAPNPLTAPEGLPRSMEDRLLEVTDPASDENPWSHDHTKFRNALIVRLLLELGLRRGELLGIRIPDIDFQSDFVAVIRRPDNSDDPRSDPPLVKTYGRKLRVEPELLRMVRTYVMEYRPLQGRARHHDYLLVAFRTGRPMTQIALQKVFETLKQKPLGLPESLTPHVLRHTWNERFSDLMDERRVERELEKKMRAYQMGWSETSTMPAIYLRRHTRKRAEEFSLELQRRIFGDSLEP